MSIEEPLVN